MKSYLKIAAAMMLALGAAPVLAQDYDGSGNNYGEGDNIDAGETISNTATITYTVEGVEQETTGDSVDFVVDRVILLYVSSNGGKNVVPGQDDAYLSFDVRNDSNDTIDMVLQAYNDGSDFDATGLEYWLDVDEDGMLNAGDTQLPAGTDGPAVLIDMDEGETRTVFVVGDIPTPTEAGLATQTVDNGDTDTITLLATAYTDDAGATPWVETVGADTAAVDTVFGDTAGSYNDGVADEDEARDGRHSADGTFTISTASISVVKTSKVISDPFNGVSANAKAIPGAVIEYCILITNAGATDATGVEVSDPIPDFTTYVDGTIGIADDCDGTNLVAEDDDAAGGDESDDNGGNFDATPGSETVNTVVALLEGGGDATATIFRVTVD